MVNTTIRLIIFFAAKDGEALYSLQKQDLLADCGSGHELLITKFRLKLKKIGKPARPFRYGLNQIQVEVRNRFKGLDLIDRVPDELWMVLIPVSSTMSRTSSHSSSGTLSDLVP